MSKFLNKKLTLTDNNRLKSLLKKFNISYNLIDKIYFNASILCLTKKNLKLKIVFINCKIRMFFMNLNS